MKRSGFALAIATLSSLYAVVALFYLGYRNAESTVDILYNFLTIIMNVYLTGHLVLLLVCVVLLWVGYASNSLGFMIVSGIIYALSAVWYFNNYYMILSLAFSALSFLSLWPVKKVRQQNEERILSMLHRERLRTKREIQEKSKRPA
jgi:hypothetical protein